MRYRIFAVCLYRERKLNCGPNETSGESRKSLARIPLKSRALFSNSLLNAGCRKAEDTQRYAMNKVIYALLRGWPWVLIGPRLSLSFSVSLSLSLHPLISRSHVVSSSSPSIHPVRLTPHLLWSVLLLLLQRHGCSVIPTDNERGLLLVCPSRRLSKEIRGHCPEENTHRRKLRTIIHLLMHEYGGRHDCPRFHLMKETALDIYRSSSRINLMVTIVCYRNRRLLFQNIFTLKFLISTFYLPKNNI